MSKQVRAKFHCDSILKTEWEKIVNMTAVTGNEGENKDFNKATPSGNLEIAIQGDVPASDFFIIGEDYYLDFTRAEQ